MQRVYTVFPSTSRLLFVVLILFVALFVVLQPRILSTVFYPPRHQVLKEFLATVQRDGKLSLPAYWQFRERYSAGNFTFDPRVVTFGETQIVYDLPASRSALLTYHSPQLESVDYIIQRRQWNSPKREAMLLLHEFPLEGDNWTEIFNGDRTRLFSDNDGEYLLVFVRTIDEMKTVNGFFDFTKPEIAVMRSSLWLNVTHIKDN